MSLFAWNAKYSVGVKTFDEHHKYLLDQINQLYDAMMEGKGSSVVRPILDNLIRYTDFHFESEEKAMRLKGFAGYESHAAEHASFRRRVHDYSEMVKTGQAGLSVQIASFLKDWLTNHILQVDMQYQPVFHETGL